MSECIKFRPIPPRSPHLNGKVERRHGDVSDKKHDRSNVDHFFYVESYRNANDITATLFVLTSSRHSRYASAWTLQQEQAMFGS
jgi:hypothetical protein